MKSNKSTYTFGPTVLWYQCSPYAESICYCTVATPIASKSCTTSSVSNTTATIRKNCTMLHFVAVSLMVHLYVTNWPFPFHSIHIISHSLTVKLCCISWALICPVKEYRNNKYKERLRLISRIIESNNTRNNKHEQSTGRASKLG